MYENALGELRHQARQAANQAGDEVGYAQLQRIFSLVQDADAPWTDRRCIGCRFSACAMAG